MESIFIIPIQIHLWNIYEGRKTSFAEKRVLRDEKKELFPFSKYNRWSTFKARRSLDSGLSSRCRRRDVARNRQRLWGRRVLVSWSERMKERQSRGKVALLTRFLTGPLPFVFSFPREFDPTVVLSLVKLTFFDSFSPFPFPPMHVIPRKIPTAGRTSDLQLSHLFTSFAKTAFR